MDTRAKHRKIRGVWVDFHGREIAGMKVTQLNQEPSQIDEKTGDIIRRGHHPLRPEMPGYHYFKDEGYTYVEDLPDDMTTVPGIGKKSVEKILAYFDEEGIQWERP